MPKWYILWKLALNSYKHIPSSVALSVVCVYVCVCMFCSQSTKLSCVNLQFDFFITKFLSQAAVIASYRKLYLIN